MISTKVLVIGSGPAGCTAAIYATRAGLDTVLVHGMQPGGQLTITTDVENYPGFADIIQGPWLMDQMIAQAVNVGTTVVQDTVVSVSLDRRPFITKTASGKLYRSDVLIICTGSVAKWLGIPSEVKFQGAGVSGCATCDAVFYRNKVVMVVGGGNTAVEEALHLTKFASKIMLLHRRDTLRAEKILQDRLFANKKVEFIWNTVLEEILGTDDPKSVTGVRISDVKTSKRQEIALDGVFIAIGHTPNTELFKGRLDMDASGYLITKPNSTATNIDGVFAAGDVQDSIFRQAVTAAGTGCMAALEADKFISSLDDDK